MTTETLAAPAAGTTPAAAAPTTGTTPSASEFSSFLGVEAETLPSLQPVQDPEPAGTETAGDEPAVEAEGERGAEETLETEAPETDATEEVAATEEDNDSWLPQEQAKEFPEATLKEYAERRGYKWDPADESQMRLLRDKLNTDIYVEQLRQEVDNQAFEETTAANEEDQPGSEELATTEGADPRAQHYTQVDAVVAQIDKQATEALGRDLLGAMGVNADPAHIHELQTALRNPQTTPAQRAEIQQHLDLVTNAGKIGTTLARGAVDLIVTTIPNLLPSLLESVAPGLLGAYQGWQQVREVGQEWQKISEAKGPNQQPLYPNLPAYQSKEYFDLVLRTERELGQPKGWIGELNMPLSQKLAMIARVANGLTARPAATRQVVARAVSAGRQQERTQQQRRAAGRAMGAGATSQQFETEPAGDPVKDALRKAIADQNSQADPFRGATVKGN
jgi:hypothetical protein